VAGEDGRAAVIARGTSIDLAWTPSGPDDLVFADVQPSAVRCVLDGASAGPTLRGSTGLVHAALSTSLMDDAGTIVIHRLHREPLHMRGLEGGEVRFDFARTVAYTRR
jgi:acyl-coenzyme A thioesterase PaaI-like protein